MRTLFTQLVDQNVCVCDAVSELEAGGGTATGLRPDVFCPTLLAEHLPLPLLNVSLADSMTNRRRFAAASGGEGRAMQLG